MRFSLSALLCCSTLSLTCAAAQPKKAVTPVESSEAAAQIIGGALSDGVAFARLEELTDTVGPRLSGSAGAAAGVEWAKAKFESDGISVHLEPVKVPHWVRGIEVGEIVAPAEATRRPLSLTALGGSAGTPAGGITAEVIEASSIEEVGKLGEKVRGKIVLFQHSMSTSRGYGENAGLRAMGPVTASKAGAVGVLIRSLATASFRSPHTGMMRVDPDVPTLPSAALSTEDAELIHRLLQRGPVKVHFELGAQTLPDEDSFNVVAEVRGREKPEEIMLLGAHLDSWDLATGAIDDGAGVVMVMESLRLISHLRVPPRRTVRVVLFMNEENGLRGGKAYAAQHANEIANHVAAMECDIGAGKPLSFIVHSGEGGAALLRSKLAALDTLGCGGVADGDRGGSDISPLAHADNPPPILELDQDTTHYFDVHHSAADTLDKVDPRDIAESTAAVAWTAWSIAEMPEKLPRPPKATAPEH